MMAAVLFRPVSEPEKANAEPLFQPQAGMGPAAPAMPGLVPMKAEAGPADTDAQPVEATSTTAPGVTPAIVLDVTLAPEFPARGEKPFRPDPSPSTSTATPVPTPQAAGTANRILNVAIKRTTLAGTGATDDSQDTDALPVFDGESAVITLAESTTPMDSAVTSEPAPRETASPLLGLIEGASDDKGGPAASPEVSTSTVSDHSGRLDLEGVPTWQVLLSGQAPAADVPGTNLVTAARASAVQSMPLSTQVAETVHAALLRGDHEIRLLLNPGDLGRIDIRITEQAGALRLHLDASHGPTRDLLAREMPVLQQALEARDLRVERIQVSHSGSASAGGSGAAWQGFGGQGSGRQGGQQERDGLPSWSPLASLAQSARQSEVQRASRIIRHHGTLDRVA